MSFANLVNTTLTNTILMPYRYLGKDAEGENSMIEPPKIAKTFKNPQTEDIPTTKDFKISIKSSGDKTATEMTYCKTLSGFTVSRAHAEQKAGGVYDYTALLPSASVVYTDITLGHVATTDAFFLKWLIDGTDQGCGIYAQLEITIGKKGKGQVIYTLNGAIPTSWTFGGTFAASATATPVVVMDTIIVAYSSLDVRAV
jgi:hypothetical protein